MKALLSKQKVINKVVLIPVDQVVPNPNQPRRSFDPDKLEQLASSIAQYGVLQPVTVLLQADGRYQLVSGERRLLACRMLKMESVPAIVTEMAQEDSAALALIENIQRQDLNFFEEAAAIQRLVQMTGLTQQAVAARLGKNQSTVANKLRLLQFSGPLRQKMLESGLTERHARALLSLAEQGEEAILEAVEAIAQRQMNVSQTEEYVRSRLEPKETHKAHRLFVVKDLRIFLNSIDKAIQTMKLSGIRAKTQMAEEEDCLVYTVRIPKESAYRSKTRKTG